MKLHPATGDKFSVGLFTAGFVWTLLLTAAGIRGADAVFEIIQAKQRGVKQELTFSTCVNT